MRYHVLATDYDGTIANDGTVDAPTLEALERLKASGRKLILVTGRIIEDLLRVFHRADFFDAIVVENGAVLYWPATEEQEKLADAPHPALAKLLRQRGVEPLDEGRVILDTTDQHRDTVLQAIEELGLELQIVFNKGSIMVLPTGVNKATGLQAALDRMGISIHNVVGVGDAENDHAFITSCECGVAVKNALGSLMEKADFVTHGASGGGVIELVDAILEDELAGIDPKLAYKGVVLGRREDSSEIGVVPYGVDVELGPRGRRQGRAALYGRRVPVPVRRSERVRRRPRRVRPRRGPQCTGESAPEPDRNVRPHRLGSGGRVLPANRPAALARHTGRR